LADTAERFLSRTGVRFGAGRGLLCVAARLGKHLEVALEEVQSSAV